jgi:hypothetical protein
MSAATVLRVQELCDNITDFLPESKWDLRSCALVCPSFTSSAQRHLFHDIIFNRGCLDIDDRSTLSEYDEAGACRRFCAVLDTSPHLIPLVRRLRFSTELDVLRPLSRFQFPNLVAVLIHRRRGGPSSEACLSLIKQLISAPSIRRVGLLSLIFPDIRTLGRIFENCAPELDSILLHYVSVSDGNDVSQGDGSAPPHCVKVKTLRFEANYGQDAPWLVSPLSPFDWSELAELDPSPRPTSAVLAILDRAKRTIRRLTLDAR